MIDLSVVIVNYNARHFIQICLDALQMALDGINAETIVVDNLSTDDSCSVIKAQYPWVNLVENKKNVGFGRANNQGFKIAKGKNILILNPDTIVDKATLIDCLKALENDSNIGSIGVKMLDGSGNFLPESKRGLPTPQVAFYKAFGLANLFPKSKRYARYYLGHLSENENNDIEVLAGAYMMCPAIVLEKTGGFDEAFFMYGEDIDLSYRITQLGYKNIYRAKYPIIHFKGESAGRDAIWAKRFYEAMELFSEKHFSKNSKFYSYIINCGIKVRKAFFKAKIQHETKADLSKLNLLIFNNKQDTPLDFLSLFNSYKYQNKENNIDANISAILFTSDIDKQFAISLMNESKDKFLYFFTSADGIFALCSPSSTSLGEIWSLK